MRSGRTSIHIVGNHVPSGRLMVLDDTTVFGFGRATITSGSRGLADVRLHLYRADQQVEVPDSTSRLKNNNQALSRDFVPSNVNYRWTRRVPLAVRAMVLAGEVIKLLHRSRPAPTEGVPLARTRTLLELPYRSFPERDVVHAMTVIRAARESSDPVAYFEEQFGSLAERAQASMIAQLDDRLRSSSGFAFPPRRDGARPQFGLAPAEHKQHGDGQQRNPAGKHEPFDGHRNPDARGQ